MRTTALAAAIEIAFVEQLVAELDAYAFAMESDVILEVPASLRADLEACWEELPDYDCEVHGRGKLAGKVGIHAYGGLVNMVHRDLVDGVEADVASPVLMAVAANYPPFSR